MILNLLGFNDSLQLFGGFYVCPVNEFKLTDILMCHLSPEQVII